MQNSMSRHTAALRRSIQPAWNHPIASFASSSRLTLDSFPDAGPRTRTSGRLFQSTQQRFPDRPPDAQASESPLISSGPYGFSPSEDDTPHTSKYRIDPLTPSVSHPGRDDKAYEYILSAHCTRNNTILTFADKTGPIFGSVSGGSGGTFKNSHRNSHEAAHQATLKMLEKISNFKRDTRNRQLKILLALKGLNGAQGRTAVVEAMAASHDLAGQVVRVEDRTAIKIGGTRAKKPRRL